MRLQDAGLDNTAPVRPGRMPGERIGPWMAHYLRYRDRRIIQSGLSLAQREAGSLPDRREG